MRFLGVSNFTSKYILNKSELANPLNSLLKNEAQFVWRESQIRCLKKIKLLLQQAPVLAHYDFNKNIIVQADASNYGLGCALLQVVSEKGEREIVAFGPGTLTGEKSSLIEKETLALAFATDHFREYVTGIRFTLEMDHNNNKSLLQVLGTKLLNGLRILEPRLQRIRLRLMRYNYNIIYIPGQQLVLADLLSRSPVFETAQEGERLGKRNKYLRFICHG